MKAMVIDRYGGSDQLTPREVERPQPGRGEVLIRVRASGVNPVDWKIRRGMLRLLLRSRFPLILGGDVAGEIEAVGPGVTRWRESEPVFALLDLRRGGGGYAEYAVAPETAVARRPDSLSVEEAASMPIAALTALQSLRDLGRLAKGQLVLVNGASGGVGTFAVQIGKALGARVVGVCRADNAELVQGLGADEIIDYQQEDFTRRPERYHVVLDAVAKSSFADCARILEPEGIYISTLPGPGVLLLGAFLPGAGLLGYGKRAKLIVVKGMGDDLALLGRYADEGRLRPVIDRVYPLEQVREAHDQSESGRVRGKIVLRVP
ncbi:NADP-dependent oxidoreductase [soil metagenome]